MRDIAVRWVIWSLLAALLCAAGWAATAEGIARQIEQLQKGDAVTRIAAVQALAKDDDARAITPLLRALRSEKDPAMAAKINQALLQLTGRTFSAAPADPAAKPPLSPVLLGIRPAQGGAFRFGQVAETIFTLVNDSPRALVVTTLHPVDNPGEDDISLSGRVFGEIENSLEEDAYIHELLVQQAARRILYAGLLLPGQALQVRSPYRAISPDDRFLVKYLPAAKPYNGTAASLRPLVVYVYDRTGVEKDATSHIYRPFTPRLWQTASNGFERTREIGPDAGERAVLLTAGTKDPRECIIAARLTPAAPAFFVEEARTVAQKITGIPAAKLELAYSVALGGYVVAEGKMRWVLKDRTQTARGLRLPLLPLLLCKEVDCGDIHVKVSDKQDGPNGKDAGWKFWDSYPVTFGDGMYLKGEFIIISAKQLVDFLSAVGAKGGVIERVPSYFRNYYYTLTLPEEHPSAVPDLTMPLARDTTAIALRMHTN